MFFEGRNAATPPLQDLVSWRERENLYAGDRRYVQSHFITGVAIPDGPILLKEWHQLWSQSGVNSRQVYIAYAFNDNNTNVGRLRRVSPEPQGFRIVNLTVSAGPKLRQDEWSRFGADIESVGSSASK